VRDQTRTSDEALYSGLILHSAAATVATGTFAPAL